VPVTGGYGAAVVSGEAGMATAGSPQGVEVPVPGAGQAMTLGRDGCFALSGIPADAPLPVRDREEAPVVPLIDIGAGSRVKTEVR